MRLSYMIDVQIIRLCFWIIIKIIDKSWNVGSKGQNDEIKSKNYKIKSSNYDVKFKNQIESQNYEVKDF